MQFNDVSIPDIYNQSSDFRVLLKWFAQALTRVKFDTENLLDLYDPLRCPDHLLWMLADTMGFKYDNRLPIAYNRLVLMYFMSMIRNRGSNDGVTLAAETNLAQFNILQYGKEKEILYNRLEDTSIPVNSVYVTPHVEEGYIDIVYFSTEVPIDACIEYVRPLGMYCFQHAGVRFDARTKVSIDARLTNTNNIGMSIGATHVGHYRREDYARLQRTLDQDLPQAGQLDGYKVVQQYSTETNESGTTIITDVWYQIAGPNGQIINPNRRYDTQAEAVADIPYYGENDTEHVRHPVYYRNSEFEVTPNTEIDPGYRAMYSLQLCNNEHTVKALLDPIFSLGYGPQSEDTLYPDDYLTPADGSSIYADKPIGGPNQPATRAYNLRYRKDLEISVDQHQSYTIDDNRSPSILKPRPAVNPIAARLGDAMSMNAQNTRYTKVDENGNVSIVDVTE